MELALVKLCPNNVYRRYVGRKQDFAIQSEAPLCKEDIELIRSNPKALNIEDETEDTVA